jgi:hypothetical protein
MAHASERRLREGVTVAVHRNAGLRKVCECTRRGWAKCPHPRHFNYAWRGTAYRFSLNRYAGKEITGNTEAETLAGANQTRDSRRHVPRSAASRRHERGGERRQPRQTTVLRAHGHKPVWIWKKKTGPNDKGGTRLSPESEAAYHAIDLHFHDLRHEGGSRLLEAGWPVRYVQHMLGHASLQQTSTYLNATLRGLHESMRNLDRSRPACKPLANKPARGLRPVRKQAPARSEKSFLH